MTVRTMIGDVRERLKELPDNSVHCVVTSPPYWGLRDYGTALWEGGMEGCSHQQGRPGAFAAAGSLPGGRNRDGVGAFSGDCKCGARRIDQQLGLEPTYQEHVAIMASIFDEVRRVLRKDGTLWLNYGDSYATAVNGRSAADTKAVGNDDRTFRDKPFSTVGGVLKPKDLCGIPWRVAFALQERGWWLRQDIIWAKANPMPESVTDRCTKAHEYIFLLSKSPRYFFDAEAIREAVSDSAAADWYRNNVVNRIKPAGSASINGENSQSGLQSGITNNTFTRNRRSVWTIATAPYSEAHFATFPPELAELCIKAGTSQKGCCGACGAPWVRDVEPATGGSIGQSWHDHSTDEQRGNAKVESSNGYQRGGTIGWSPSCQCNAAIVPCTVLDPFGGAGTTGLVADRLQRHAILIELNPEYAALTQKRIDGDRGGLLDLMEAAQ